MLIQRTVTVADLRVGDIIVGSQRRVVRVGQRERGYRTVTVVGAGAPKTYQWAESASVTIARETGEDYLE